MADGENEKKDTTNKGYGKALFGRRVIYSDVDEITPENIMGVLYDAMPKHIANRCDINYLYDYYRGKQPILERVKEVRGDINNKVVCNLSYDIVDFKVAYLLSSPFAYVAMGEKSKPVNILNDYMNQVGKKGLDKDLVEWNHICGTAYRYVQALEPKTVEKGDAPFDLDTLDPRTTFVIYSSTFKKKRLAGVTYTISDTDGKVIRFVVYTPTKTYTFKAQNKFESLDDFTNSKEGFVAENNALGEIPIFEYPANNARLGAFEPVLPLLDSLNRVLSNDIDGVEIQIQSFLKFVNCELDKNALEDLQRYGAIKIKSLDGAPADVDTVKTDYSYDGANSIKEDIYRDILLICGMPITGNGKSISANNGAVLVQNGWSQAESKARASETMFEASERLMLKLVLKIVETIGEKLDIRSSDITVKTERTNNENLQVKTQALCEMLNTQRVHPKLAFEACGLFSDPENAYLISEIYYNEQLEKWEVKENPEEDKAVNNGEENGEVRTDGHNNRPVTE